MQSEATFRFLDLPPELRLYIYEIALKTKTAIDVKALVHLPHVKYNAPGILLVNKQILEEATPIFYRTSTFQVDYGLEEWLLHMPAHYRDAIQNIRCGSHIHSSMNAAKESFMNLAWRLCLKGIKLRKGVLRMRMVRQEGVRWRGMGWVDAFGQYDKY